MENSSGALARTNLPLRMLKAPAKNKVGVLSAMPADGIGAADIDQGLRHVLLAARGHSMSVCPLYNIGQDVGRQKYAIACKLLAIDDACRSAGPSQLAIGRQALVVRGA